MAPAISINLFALVSLALFYISLAPSAANALSVERAHVARNVNHAHAGIAKKKRDSPSKRCKPRPSSSTPPPSSTPSYTPPSSPTDLPTTTSYSPMDTPSTSPSSTSTTSTTTPASSPTPASSSSGAGKFGLGWSNMEETSLCNFSNAPHTGFVYDWKSGGYGDIVNPSSCGFTYLPMCWGPSNFPGCISDIKALSPRPVMFINEPDQSGQSNVAVGDAVGIWFQYFQPLSNQGYQLVTAAPTNSPNGLDWIKQFVAQVEQGGGSIFAVATHIYSTDLSYSISFIQSFTATFSKYQTWVTEFACQDYSGNNQQLDYNGVFNYMTSFGNFLNDNPSVGAYFPFCFFTQSELTANNVNPANACIGDDGKPTALGYAMLSPS